MNLLLALILLTSLPTTPDMSVTIPYSETLKEDFEKKAQELIKEMKLKGCLRGTISATADEAIKVITITATCLEWEKS